MEVKASQAVFAVVSPGTFQTLAIVLKAKFNRIHRIGTCGSISLQIFVSVGLGESLQSS